VPEPELQAFCAKTRELAQAKATLSAKGPDKLEATYWGGTIRLTRVAK